MIPDVEVRRPGPDWIPDFAHARAARALTPELARCEVFKLHRPGRPTITVLSDVENVSPGGWTWHVSASEGGGRPGREAMAAVREAFGMQEAEEDNHAPEKTIRSLWLPIDPAQRRACPCQVEEPTVLEGGEPGDLDRVLWRPGHEEPR